MFRKAMMTVFVIAISAAGAGAAGMGEECKVGSGVAPEFLCPPATACLKAIGKMYCSNLGKNCGWPGRSGYNIGANKSYNGKDYECTLSGFKLDVGEKCTSASKCASGSCLMAINNSYCSNLGMVCGWPDTGGYIIGATRQHNGNQVTCTTSGFEHVQPTPTPVPLPQIRQLTSAEISLINSVFGRTVNTSQVRVTDTVGASGRPWTTNSPPLYTINVGGVYSSLASSAPRLLIHEIAHVWQGQHGVPFMSNSAVHQTLSAIANGGDVGGAYSFRPGTQWSTYNVEQQASIIEDWFGTGMSKGSNLYPYIRDNVRTGQPNATTQFD